MRRVQLRSTHTLAVLTGAGLATAAMAVGAATSGTSTIHACVAKKNGAARIAARCRHTDHALTWNQKGPRGATGAPGTAGAAGAKGDKGDKGDTGNGVLLRDANNAALGHVIGTTSNFTPPSGWQIVTSTGNVATIMPDGTFPQV